MRRTSLNTPRYTPAKTIIVAFGGSIVHPDAIDTAFLKKFRLFIYKSLTKGFSFVIVIGGGKLARNFQMAAAGVTKVSDEDKDWIGIHSTRLHAHLLRTIFRDVADHVVVDERHKIKKLSHRITIASGWRPGWSTDFVAAALAHDFGVDTFIVAGKPAYVYTADPSKNKNARSLKEISWSAYRKLIPKEWSPGSHAPVDPIAARFAQKNNLKAIIVNGKDLKNFERLLLGKTFEGTIIE